MNWKLQYRPTSILPVLSKILENAVYCQFYSFLEENKLLRNCQFGIHDQILYWGINHKSTVATIHIIAESLYNSTWNPINAHNSDPCPKFKLVVKQTVKVCWLLSHDLLNILIMFPDVFDPVLREHSYVSP